MIQAPSRWIVAERPDPAVVRGLAGALKVPDTLASLLVQRGYTDADRAKAFLRPSLDTLADPASLAQLPRAVELIADAVRAGTRIMVHGDYDVDGQCSTAILTRTLRQAGADVVPFVPNRLRDGYDFGPAGLAMARASDVGLIVTCDCGTTAVEAVEAARADGRRVVVTDHHLPGAIAPADAVVNPQQPGCASDLNQLCGAGVVFKLVQALVPTLGLPDNFAFHLLDLVALATVADVVPLTGENRTLVRFGLKLLSTSRWPGVRALVEVAGLGGRDVRVGHVGFILAPRLNAAGRIGEAMDGVRLLLSDDPDEARSAAQRLETINARRQAMDETMLEEAVEEVAEHVDLASDYGLVLAREGWHPGVIGLVASRIVERYTRPTVLVAFDGDVGKGSGRSISGFDLHAALTECAPHLSRYGGHRMAAGLTVERGRLDEFRAAFNRVARERLTEDDLVPTQRIDVVTTIATLDDELERLLRHLEPCGPGNPGPVLGIAEGAIRSDQVVGGSHLKFTLEDASGRIPAIAFNWADRLPLESRRAPVDVALRLERNEWRGTSTLQARVVQIKPAG
ncbi:MAG: single-stranded-DNA-specific exonuclease RecJ [Gemmatimonadales bacterium]|nr:single-stranded-DNA-specific exonuclease RecJ [Gemmatimonadales bacterium]